MLRVKAKPIVFLILFLPVLGIYGCLKQSTITPQQPADSAIQTSYTNTNTPVVAPQTAIVQPARYSLDIKGAEWLLKSAQDGLSFQVVGIYAIDNRIGFLFGSFMSGASDVRSALFRTDDGGQHWLEVMQPFILSNVSHVLFVQNGEGWASIGLTSEGLSGTTYWHTSDYGKSWEEIPNVNTGRMDVLGIRFLDSLHGQRILYDGTGTPDRDGLVIQTTSDGGYTWKEDLRVLNPGLQKPDTFIAAYADTDGGKYGSHWGTCKWDTSNGCHAFGADGSEWKISSDEKPTHYILQIQMSSSGISTGYLLPIKFRYNDGMLFSLP